MGELDAGFLCSSHENEVSPRSRGNRFVVLARKSQTQCVDPQVPLLGASAPCALSTTMSINELRDRILLKAEAAEPLLGVSRHELLSGHLPKLASPRSEQQSRRCS